MDLDSFVKVENVDPVADFIAREQNVLAELEGDLEFTDDLTHLSQEISDDNITDMTNSDDNNPFSGSSELPTIITNGNHNVDEISNDITITNTNGALISDDFNEPPVEHEKITRWRTASVKMLSEKDAEEAEKMAELKEHARQELLDWYSAYNDQLNKLKTSNREAEAQWISDRDTDVPGKEWEKVSRMLDFNPKPNQKNIKDTSRMKSILISLKQHPPKESTPSS